jgi:hypothetical protein
MRGQDRALGVTAWPCLDHQTGAKGIADNGSVGLLTSKAACSRISTDRSGSSPRKETKATAMVPQ